MPSLPLPRFLEQAREHRQHAANLGRSLIEQDADLRERTIARDPSDSATLRGIPAIGRGVAGVIRGTDPGSSVS